MPPGSFRAMQERKAGFSQKLSSCGVYVLYRNLPFLYVFVKGVCEFLHLSRCSFLPRTYETADSLPNGWQKSSTRAAMFFHRMFPSGRGLRRLGFYGIYNGKNALFLPVARSGSAVRIISDGCSVSLRLFTTGRLCVMPVFTAQPLFKFFNTAGVKRTLFPLNFRKR